MRNKFCLAVFAMLVITQLPTQSATAQQKRPYTIADYMGIKWLTSAQISGDGSQVLYTMDESRLSTAEQVESIWIVSTAGGQSRKLAEVNPLPSSPPALSPDGKRVAFASGPDGKEQIWLVETSNSEPVKLTQGANGLQSFAWSPDGLSIAFVMIGPVSNQATGEQLSGTESPQLYLLDVAKRQVRQLTTGVESPGAFAWSPDGREIAFTAQGDIYVAASDNGSVTKLVSRPGQDINPTWSPDGKQILFFSDYGQVNGPRGLSVVSANGGAPGDKYGSFDPGFGGYAPWYFGWSADGAQIYSTRLSRMSQQLFAIEPTTGVSKPVTSGDKVYHDFSFSRDGKTMAFLASDSITPDEVYVSTVSEFKPVRLTTSNPQLNRVAFGKTEAIRWKSKDGLEIEGLLLKPFGYEAGKHYPLLVLMEGTFGSFDYSFTSRVSADNTRAFAVPFQQQILAAQGYAVLMPNPRGSWGYGVEFSRRARGDFGIGPYNDLMTGVDAVIDQGLADPERIGVMGLYVDGYRAIFATTQTNRFKAQVIGLPIFNLVSWYGQLGPEATYADRYFGGAPWQVPQNYQNISPVNYAGNIKTPTLLFTTDRMEFPPVQQAREFYTALKRNNVPMDYVVYKPQGFFLDPKSQADLLQRTNAWFERWLKTK